ncbi:MAG: hypothetical protein HY705_02900 [Gemmatimonadetes bacterium]|nr:hypothetical protein [Gemmatimonadota bacterium]
MAKARARLRELSLRSKLLITLAGAGIAVLGISTYLSFRYWRREALAAAEQQALLVAGSLRAPLESALRSADPAEARRVLRTLVRSAPVMVARVYAGDGSVVLSTTAAEAGLRIPGLWIPAASALPPRGVVRRAPSGEAVRAFLPLTAPGAALLEVQFSVAPVKAAMDRGARLGIGLLLASLFALASILFTMLEREVVAPLQRVSGLLAGGGPAARPEAELSALEASVAELIDKERAAEAEAAAHQRKLTEQAGLAEVGELAAEMAHELKRPLASVRAAMQLLERQYVPDERGQALVHAIDAQLEKLAEIMRDLFALARPGGLERERVDPRELLNAALAQVAAHPATRGVTILREYDAGAPDVAGDRRRLEQAVLNVLLNAVEAMPAGGTLTVRAGATAEGGLRLEFEDTGPGIPPEEVERVLRPFYSTKPLGTGLGLPLVARIVAAHEGRLGIQGRPGRGTTVTIHLPARAAEVRGLSSGIPWRTHESSLSMTTISSD